MLLIDAGQLVSGATRNIPYSRRHIDRLEVAGKFPKRVAIGDRRVGWVESEIDEYFGEDGRVTLDGCRDNRVCQGSR